MRRLLKYFITVLVVGVIALVSNFAIFALNPDENAGFITREEFNEWQEQFIASLSELDKESTNKIYDDMDFYDMKFRFTEKYKGEEYIYPEDYPEEAKRGQPTPKLEEMIKKGEAKRRKL